MAAEPALGRVRADEKGPGPKPVLLDATPTPSGRSGRPAARELRIAMVAPPWFTVPPHDYGGTESVIAYLVDGLVERGHEVTLIATGAAGTKAQRFVPVYPEPPSARLGEPLPEVLQAAAAAALVAGLDVDIVHDHTLAGPLAARYRPVPTVVTGHGPVTGEPGDYLAWLGASVEVVAISKSQQAQRRDINWAGTVHNAVDVTTYPLGHGDGGYVLFIGRFSPDKAPHLAIDAARQAGRPIVLAGKVNEPVEKQYFETEIEPRLGRQVNYVGLADAVTKRDLYAGAEALVFPICWEEPFGLVMIEAMACGTPVVALRRGSVPEIVRHEVTGFVVDDPSELAGCISAASQLDRRHCRAHVEQNFGTAAMVAGYEAVYHTVVSSQRGDGPSPAPMGDEDFVPA